MEVKAKKSKKLISLLLVPVFMVAFLLMMPVAASAASVDVAVTLTGTTAVGPGATVTLTLTVANSAGDPTTGAVDIVLGGTGKGDLGSITVNSSDGSITGSGDNLSVASNLASGTNATATLSFTAPTTDGSYELTATGSLNGDTNASADTLTAKVNIVVTTPGGNPDPGGDPGPATPAPAPSGAGYGTRHTEFWTPMLFDFADATSSTVLRRDCNGMDFVPHYIITAVRDTKCTLVMTWEGYSFTIKGSNLGALDPTLNYRFEDLRNLGMGTKLK